MSLFPLKLSPYYIPIEDKPEPTELSIEPRKVQKTHKEGPSKTRDDSLRMGRTKQYFYSIQIRYPVQYRFIRFHGRGDMVSGHACFEQYWNKLDKEVKQIIKILGVARSKAAFAKYIGICPTILSQYNKKQKIHKKFWLRLLTMKKIVDEFDGFIKRGKVS